MEKQQVKIMNEKEFDLYHKKMTERVKEWNGWSKGERRYAMICWLGAEKEYAFTGPQLKALFNLCF